VASDMKRQADTTSKWKWLPARFKPWLGSWQEWISVIFSFLTLEIAVYSVERVQWIRPQPPLTVTLILAVLTIWLLAKSRFPKVAIHLLAVALGAMVTIWQASNLLSLSVTTSRVNQLIVTLFTTNPNEGTIHFATFLIFTTWIIGYVSTWYILHKQNAWVTVSLGAIVILINLSNLTAKNYSFFFFYLLAALLLLAQTNLTRRFYWFKKWSINHPKRSIIYFIASVLCLSLVMVSIAWQTPEVRVNQLETLFNSKTSWRNNIANHWINLVAAIPAKQSSISSLYQEKLHFGGRFDLSNTVRFIITSEQPSYWRLRTYDIYTSDGWESSPTTEQVLQKGTYRAKGEESSNRTQLTYSVVTNIKTDMLLTAGEFLAADNPAQLQTLTPLSFQIDLTNPYASYTLPPDVWSLLPDLAAATEGQEKTPLLNSINQALSENLELTSIGKERYPPTEAYYQLILDSGRQLENIELTRTFSETTDVITVITPHFLQPNQQYTVTSSITSATTDDLSEAGEDYPLQVTDYYLQIPYTLPYSVRWLSKTITEEATTPYEKAVAIKDYLSQLRYNYNAKSELPPPWLDGVDYFLTTKKSGDCVYFASAMAVMLRSVGVPARVCTGYLPGNRSEGKYIVRAKHYHAWPEVYFPGYGWIIFEVTPAAGSRPSGALIPPDILDDVVADETTEVVAGSTSYQWLAWIPLFTVIGIVLIIVLRFVISRWLRRFTGVAYVTGVYARMCLLASLVKLRPEPQHTPLEYGTRLTSVFPPQAEAFNNIVQAYQESRFSYRKELDIQQKQRLQESWHKVYNTLLKRLFHIK